MFDASPVVITKKKKNAFPTRFILSMLCVILFDQFTKFSVNQDIPYPTYSFLAENKPIEIIKNFFYLVNIRNEGAAWGILAGQTYLLSCVAFITLLAVWLFRSYLAFYSNIMQLALGLFVGGIIGNLIDRIHLNAVIDFIDVHIPIIDYRWPAFNIADCGIAIGVSIYIIFSLLFEKKLMKEIKNGDIKYKDL